MAAAAAAAPTEELLSLEGAMRAPDAIMEPGMAEVVGRYIRAGGKPEEVIESLTTSYEGCAQMAGLVCSWMRLVGAPYAPPGAPSTAGGGGAFDAAPVATAAAAGPGRRGDMPPDEFTLLQELAQERFDPERLLSVFRRGRPTWLHELTGDARGRRLVLDLGAEHRGSIFLNYAIRRIFDGGHDDEVAAVGSSLSSYFEVYHRLLSRRLEAAATATTTAQLAGLAAELAEACASSQHTYTHAQLLLAQLAATQQAEGQGGDGGCGGGGVFMRLSQELEEAAAARHGGAKVWAMRPLFVPRSAGPGEREAARLVARALVLGAGGSAVGGGGLTQVSQLLTQLQELYSRGPGPDAPLAPLRHPRFIRLLLEGLFSWQQVPAGPVQRTAAHLLALASSAGAALPSPDSDAAATGSGESGAVAVLAQERLEAMRAFASRAAAGERLGEADLQAAAAAAGALPLAGLGLLHFACGLLGVPATYEDDRCAASVPQLVALLQAVAAAVPARASGVAAALGGALAAMGVRRQELAERVLGVLAELLAGGFPAEVLAAAEDWAVGEGRADPSLVRNFVMRVLERAGPPYSQQFARPVLRLMAAGKMGVAAKRAGLGGGVLGGAAAAAGGTAGGGAAERLREFAVECLEGVGFAPPLTEEESEMLERLAA